MAENPARRPEKAVILIGAAFTLGLVVIGYFQVVTFISEDRAYVSVRGFRIKGGAILANQPVTILFDVRNTGRHPAKIDDFRIELSEGTGTLPKARISNYPEPPTADIESFISGNDAFHGWMASHSNGGTPIEVPPTHNRPT
jgi:hypothetical protein